MWVPFVIIFFSFGLMRFIQTNFFWALFFFCKSKEQNDIDKKNYNNIKHIIKETNLPLAIFIIWKGEKIMNCNIWIELF